MSAHARFAFSSAAIFALALSLPFVSLTAASAAETCLEAPKGAAPAGQHWKYRLERGTQRKCWRLVQVDRKVASPQTPVQAEGDDDEEATPAPAAPLARRAVKSTDASAAEAAPPPSAPVIRDLVTRPVSNPSEAAQPLLPPQPAETAQADAAPPPPPVVEEAPPVQQAAPVAAVPAREPTVVSRMSVTADGEDAASTLRWLLGAFAIIGFLVCAGYAVAEMMRRRGDVLNRVVDRETLPLEVSPQTAPRDDEPTFAPLPPMRMSEREDDIDAAMRRIVQNARRRAA
jgi:hypothetical protein